MDEDHIQPVLARMADENADLTAVAELSQRRLQRLEETVADIMRSEEAWVLVRDDGARFIFAHEAWANAAQSTLKGSRLIKLASASAEVQRMEKALSDVMVAANHLANILVKNVRPELRELAHAYTDPEMAIRVLHATDDYDVWCCWAAIVRARDILKESAKGNDDERSFSAARGAMDDLNAERAKHSLKGSPLDPLKSALDALRLAESVYRKNCVAPGEPSSVLEAIQAAIAQFEPAVNALPATS